MRYLRKTLWAVGLIILAELLEKLFEILFPEAVLFHQNLMSAVQVVILFWLFISLLSGLVTSQNSNKKILLILFVILAIPELIFTYWLHHPSRIPPVFTSTFRYYCTESETNIIQFNPNCSVYDSKLFYTLKPSAQFVFDNYEFSDSFYTNKLGLRDDDSSLLKPDIICLGDSYAMGWGIRQNETFAEQVSRGSQKKVLNAAISSYGTARELKNLYRLDTSNLQYIIIQYCRNDFTENKQFVEQNYSLTISPKKKYDLAVNELYWSTMWFPGKHFTTILKYYAGKKIAGLLSVKKNNPVDSSLFRLHQSAIYFTDILLHSAINFKRIKVFVVDLNEKELLNNDFLMEVNTLLESPAYREHFNNNLIMVPVADIIGKDDYYFLDPHIRPSGHRKIADRLNNYISSEKHEPAVPAGFNSR